MKGSKDLTAPTSVTNSFSKRGPSGLNGLPLKLSDSQPLSSAPPKGGGALENLRQSCRIYKHLDKIFSKLLDNERIVGKLQRAFGAVLQDELDYVRKVIAKVSGTENAEAQRESSVNNLFIFKENLKLFSNLLIENQYEEIVARIRVDRAERSPMGSFTSPEDRPMPKSARVIKSRTMESIEEEGDEPEEAPAFGRHFNLTPDSKSADRTLSSRLEEVPGQPRKAQTPVSATSSGEERPRAGSNVGYVQTGVKRMSGSLASKFALPPGVQSLRRSEQVVNVKTSMKNLRDT